MTDQAAAQLLYTLRVLRLAAPATCLGILALRLVVRGFVGAMNAIQRDGYDPLQDDVEPHNAASQSNTATEDEGGAILPVVVRVRLPRRALILSLFVCASLAFFAQGALQIVLTVVNKEWLPALPQFAGMVPYTLGMLAAFAVCPVSMTFEERIAGQPAAWGSIYPRLVASTGLIHEVAITAVLAVLVKSRAWQEYEYNKVIAIDLGLSAFRVLLLLLLLLAQSRLLYSSAFLPVGEATTERTALLNGSARSTPQYGGTKNDKPKNPLRSTRPPPKAPPPLQSLHLRTLFERVRSLFPYLWPKSLALQLIALVCFGLMLSRRVTAVAVPLLFGRIAEDLSSGESAYADIALYVLASFISDGVPTLQRYMWLPVEQYSEREMTMLSFDCLLNLSLSYHTKRKTGELLRILDRSDAINDFFETVIFSLVPVLIDLPVAVVVLLVKYDTIIFPIFATTSIIFVWASVSLAQSRTKLYRSLRNESQYLYQIKTDTLMSWESVKLFTSEGFESRRLNNALRAYQLGYWNVYSAWQTMSLVQSSISAIGLLSCTFILAHRVSTGRIGVGSFVTFVSYIGSLYGPLNRIATLYQTFLRNLVDTEQLIDLLNETKDVTDRPGAVDLHFGQPDGGIEFDHVSFSYDGRKEILHDVSFKVPTGKNVALVGPSGGGKSTIMRLLFRFYDVGGGAIRIDGHDLRVLTQSSIRRAIGLVPQDPVLFNETARFNLAYGMAGGDPEKVTQAAIEEAAKSAQIHDKIMSFPDQYETRVGERGQRLSGGEKQRVAIARVLLKDPSILLLDEATSSLDTVNEKIIQARLQELSANRTTLAIAHRLSTVVHCDTIHVLNEGRIVESGNHQELLERDGLYAELWRKQAEATKTTAPAQSASSSGPSRAETPVSVGT